MRTTVTLDPDTEELIRRRMRERRLCCKEAFKEDADRHEPSRRWLDDPPSRQGTVEHPHARRSTGEGPAW
jgi:hypothetical protein